LQLKTCKDLGASPKLLAPRGPLLDFLSWSYWALPRTLQI
jgi:hypothetical protein